MTSHIKTFTEKLVEACKNPKANEDRVLRLILIKFRTLVNEANDAVATYFALEKNNGENVWAISFDKILFRGKLNMYATEIQSISAKVKTIGKDHGKDLTYLLEYKPPPAKAENNIVGFNDDLRTIKTRLVEESKDFFVIPIVGNAGSGKTTFALKIFEDLEIKKYFTHCVWIHISRGFHRKQKFIDILHQISKQTVDFSTASEDVLEAKIKKLLEDERYLIVLDSVREKEDWDSLKDAFPKNLRGSRVLVTTRNDNAVDSTWKSHSLGKLNNDDGWLLIKKNVFGTEGSRDTVFEEVGNDWLIIRF
ncbi:PREDICTED: disease resistance protein RPP8-like [Ipomoea nil]|uniref:disease resistance protein RPP8-like n=1 Tax=Ipomoea nil TaxID=35883 RepID=UPI000900D416|nr:PREDICTED: disease resistance protein RPP8-like [Ipomoea nil]